MRVELAGATLLPGGEARAVHMLSKDAPGPLTVVVHHDGYVFKTAQGRLEIQLRRGSPGSGRWPA